VSWVSLSDVLRNGNTPWAEAIAHWVADEVACPLPELGRKGALCPFVPQALRDGAIFATLDDHSDTLEAILERVRSEALRLRTTTVDNASVLIVFTAPGVGQGPLLADASSALKAELLAQRMSCGEFYPDNDDRSARNPNVWVARSPLPCLALRPSTPHDRLFLADRPHLLAALERGLVN
jgi:hypothetical protein